MNPAGFLFGPNAAVNVGGMVAFTSADYLRLQDIGGGNAGIFHADSAKTSVLTTAPVAAYGFLGSNPGTIKVQGSQITVTEGTGISLIGGNITIQSGTLEDGTVQPTHLTSRGGQINLASVASPGEILHSNLQSAPNINGQSFSAMGNISLSEGALLDVSADRAGTVRIRGGQLMLSDATISADTVNTNGAPVALDIAVSGDMTITDTRGVPAITARTTGTGDAGEISIQAGNLTASTTFVDTATFAPTTIIDSHTEGTGKGGNVSITAGTLNVQNLSDPQNSAFTFIDSGTRGPGNGGDVTITAKDIDVDFITVVSTGDLVSLQLMPDTSGISGSAGNLTINADNFKGTQFILSTEAFSSFINPQNGGNITLNVRNIDMTSGQIGSGAVAGSGVMTINADTFHTDFTTFVAATLGFGPGGGIVVHSRAVELTNGSSLLSSTFGDGNAGNIRVTATDHVTLGGLTSNAQSEVLPSGLFSNSTGDFGSEGNAGNIFVTTPRLDMVGGRINTVTQSSGHGGNVTINAPGSVSISGEFVNASIVPSLFDVGPLAPSGIVTSTIGSACSGSCGSAGNISITTGSLSIQNGGRIDSGTGGTGLGGNIAITAANAVSMSGTLSDGTPVGVFSRSVGTTAEAGAGGIISLTAGQSLTISNGASVSASTTGPGNAGNILVRANDISISGGGTITAASTGAGNAGTVTIQGLNSPANSFLVDGTGSGVFTNTEDSGDGGSVSIEANAVTLQNGGTVSASTSGTASSATGGDISISGGQFVQINNGASITASSTGPGNTGNINITAGNLFAMVNSTVTTEANQSGGGAIKITTAPSGTVELTNSMISASVLDGTGGGGSVDIDPQYVILQNSQILANAVFGPGGNIFITTNLLLPDSASVISASSQFGQQGTITIQSPISPASGKIIPIGQKPLMAAALLSQRCAALAGGNISSFTVAGRDALPAEPGSWLASPLALAAPSVGGALEARSDETNEIDQTNQPILSLRQVGPSGFLIQAFAVESAGCQS